MKQEQQSQVWHRTKRLHVRITKDEKFRLGELAKEHGLSLSDYTRLVVTRSRPFAPKAKPDRALYISTLGQLGKLGSNINQIAHELNRQRLVGNGNNIPTRIIEDALKGVKVLSDQLHTLLSDGTAREH